MLALLEDLSSTHVDHVHVTFGINHDVFRLDISVDNITGVEIFHTQDECTNIEL